MSELKIGDHDFVLGTMPARKQLHVARRLAPLMSALVGQVEAGTAAKVDMSKLQIGPIADALSRMSDDEVDYVLDACLGVVKMMQNGRAVPIMANGGRMMFDFITMPMMIRLTSEVVRQDLAGFMQGEDSISAALTA